MQGTFPRRLEGLHMCNRWIHSSVLQDFWTPHQFGQRKRMVTYSTSKHPKDCHNPNPFIQIHVKSHCTSSAKYTVKGSQESQTVVTVFYKHVSEFICLQVLESLNPLEQRLHPWKTTYKQQTLSSKMLSWPITENKAVKMQWFQIKSTRGKRHENGPGEQK